MLSVLSHLNYKPWFAMAEFVDNSLQSYLDYREELERVEERETKLKVSIELNLTDDKRIIIRDNAASIHENDYFRANLATHPLQIRAVRLTDSHRQTLEEACACHLRAL